jgi:hypothetical protein
MKMNGLKKAPRKKGTQSLTETETASDYPPAPEDNQMQFQDGEELMHWMPQNLEMKVQLINYDQRMGGYVARRLDRNAVLMTVVSGLVVELNLPGIMNSIYGNISSIKKSNNHNHEYLRIKLIRNSKHTPENMQPLIENQIEQQNREGIYPRLRLYNSKISAIPDTIFLSKKQRNADLRSDLQEELNPKLGNLQQLNDVLKDMGYTAMVQKGIPEIKTVSAKFESVSVKYQATVDGKITVEMRESPRIRLLFNNAYETAITGLNALRNRGITIKRIISSKNIRINEDKVSFESFNGLGAFVKNKLEDGEPDDDILTLGQIFLPPQVALQIKDGRELHGFIEEGSFRNVPEKEKLQFTITPDSDTGMPIGLDSRTCIGNIKIDIGTMESVSTAMESVSTAKLRIRFNGSYLWVPKSVFNNFDIKFSSVSSTIIYYIKFRTDKKNELFTKPIKTTALYSRFYPSYVIFILN